MKILVAGASGFVGTTLCRALAAAGWAPGRREKLWTLNLD